MNTCDRLTVAVVFCATACTFFALAGSLSLHVNQTNYHTSHPTIQPSSVKRADNRELCYVRAHRRSASERPGGLCTDPPSDQHWCVTQACFETGWCYYEYAYYAWPSWCFKPVLTVTVGVLTRTFSRDCGTSLECMEQFDAPFVTYVLGDEQNFVIGQARYKPRPEEIVLLCLSGLFGFLGICIAIVACISERHNNKQQSAPIAATT